MIKGTPQNAGLIPFGVRLNYLQAIDELLSIDGAGHSAWHHVSRMGPLPTEGHDDPKNLLGAMHGFAGQSSFEGWLKSRDNCVIKRMILVRRITKIRGEHQKGMP